MKKYANKNIQKYMSFGMQFKFYTRDNRDTIAKVLSSEKLMAVGMKKRLGVWVQVSYSTNFRRNLRYKK